MNQAIKILSFLFITCFLLSACGQNNEPFYHKSRMAGGPGEYSNVIDVSIEKRSISVSEKTVVTLKIGIGGDRNHDEESMFLEISAEGCKINDVENIFEKEYSDFYTDEKYDVDVKERWIGYPEKTPNYYETFDITFPSTECSGEIVIKLIDKIHDQEGQTVTLTVYYASNGSVLWFSEEVIRKIDNNNKPIYAND